VSRWTTPHGRGRPFATPWRTCVRKATLWWLGDHLALFAAQCGAESDAARLLGWAEGRLQERGERRGPAMGNAHELLLKRLRSQWTAPQITELSAEGARLSDDDVAAIVRRAMER